ncbi:5'-3' exoribonuclease 4 [Astathelohania contejeani]|uniref:5'-3' exoribonuclease 4 n=1 Tax=Astathelohania contejeani TaxID=164912 RepID=A0ABQ7HWQ1_9MICR|nr:5'-3' exoribonuclease 4 [Thelohania contejeani]
MGVPSLFRWLTEKYPDALQPLSYQNRTDILYLDFNAIVHNASRSPIAPDARSDSETYRNICAMVDAMIESVRPAQMLFISVDGVAPRAKLLQQRARRYRSADEALNSGKQFFAERANVVDSAMEKIDTEGATLQYQSEDLINECDEIFDANSITPGTQFMERLDNAMDIYIKHRLSCDPLWKNITVVYSGSRVPGEGEQKIMSFIRKQNLRSKKTRHLIYSPDADLIFLALSQHDKNVNVMRPDPGFSDNMRRCQCNSCGKTGHSSMVCGKFQVQPYVVLVTAVLRDNLALQFKSAIKRPFLKERIIDDWIFMCFFVGNDFLPTLPCFEIRCEAIEDLTSLISMNYNECGRYITENDHIDPKVLRYFLRLLACKEDSFYLKKLNAIRAIRKRYNPHTVFEEIPLHTSAGKMKYYHEKLGVEGPDDVSKICSNYLEGLAWTYMYYYRGVPSWDWCYQYHYAPFVADLCRMSTIKQKFKLGRPLTPLEQVMVVIPPMSSDLVPSGLVKLFDDNTNKVYSGEIKIDMFDKILPWQGIVLLPIKDMSDYLNKVRNEISNLSVEDIARNVNSKDIMYFSDKNALFVPINALYNSFKVGMDLKGFGLVGKAVPNPYVTFHGDIAECPDSKSYKNTTLSVFFEWE